MKLSPDLGPNVGLVIDRVKECSLPSPARTDYLRYAFGPSDLITERYYNYTADELSDNIFARPSSDYYAFLTECLFSDRAMPNQMTNNPASIDHILLQAAFETAWVHPLFVVRLMLRNAFDLLYNPGWTHGEFSAAPRYRGRLRFPLGGITAGQFARIGDLRFSEHALSEARFIPLASQSELIKEIYFAIEQTWHRAYRPLTIIIGCLAWFTWISTAIGLAYRASGQQRLARWSALWLSDRVIPASLGISALLLANVAITAIAGEPFYRYDFSLLMLKVMLGGVGATIAMELFRRAAPDVMVNVHTWKVGKPIWLVEISAVAGRSERAGICVAGLILAILGALAAIAFHHRSG